MLHEYYVIRAGIVGLATALKLVVSVTNLSSGISELKNSLSLTGYLAQCRRSCPSLQTANLTPYPPGIRAKAVSRYGALLHDFLFRRTSRGLHVLNAPSPASTSSIPIGRMIAEILGIAPKTNAAMKAIAGVRA